MKALCVAVVLISATIFVAGVCSFIFRAIKRRAILKRMGVNW